MRNRADQFSKNILREALSRASTAETEVEVMAATQKIDVYCIPDPARAAERAQMGLLGELSAGPSCFEPFSRTPPLREVRRCVGKHHIWYNELERRAGATSPDAGAPRQAPVAFPSLIIISPGCPDMVLDAYGCQPVSPGLHDGVWGLAMRVVVLSALPRTRETLLLRLLGAGRVQREALADLVALPDDSWEKGIATPLLVHFRLGVSEPDEEDEVSAEIRAWFDDYQQKLRTEERNEGRNEGRKEGHKEGALHLLLRLLRARFGELPAATVARIEAADVAELERWGERVLSAKTLADVLDDPS